MKVIMKRLQFIILILAILAFLSAMMSFNQGDTIDGIQLGFYAMWTMLIYIALKVVDK